MEILLALDEKTANLIKGYFYNKSNYKIIGICSHGFMLREFLRACNFDNDSGLKNCEIIEAEYDEKNKKLKIIRRIKNED